MNKATKYLILPTAVALLVPATLLAQPAGHTAKLNSTAQQQLNYTNQQLAQRCYRYRRVCTGPRRCLRWVQRTTTRCYLCSRYMTTRGRTQAIGRAVTCHPTWVSRLRARGWHCVLRTTPRGVSTANRHCVTWSRTNCRWICVR